MKNMFQLSALAAALLFAAGAAQAGATIINPAGTVALGINNDGSLNTTDGSVAVNTSTSDPNPNSTGLAYKFADGKFYDATAPGCLCEGWGVSVNNTHSGYANVSSDGGPNNLSFGALTGVTGSTATATTTLTSLPGIKVVQAYAPATNAPGALFVDHVTITNTTGATVSNVKYVRVMDWDIPPTEFREYVTIKGTASTTLLEESGDNGFNSADPLAAYGNADPACTGDGITTFKKDCTDSGPSDHGAYFRFNFGDLADNASYSFDIFYGAAGSESAAIAAIAAEGLELYSLGESSTTDGAALGTPATFIFGFKGVGGKPLECGDPGQPPCTHPTPEPASMALLGLGLAGLGFARRRKS